jgi:ribose 5-phosphate isomerase B
MKFFIATDHAGVLIKDDVKKMLEDMGHEVTDLGCNSTDRVNYTDYAHKLSNEVLANEGSFGILICGTGIGMSLAANKHKGIRAALCHDYYSAKMSRLHNDSNILAMGGRTTGIEIAKEMVEVWLDTEFEGGRHKKRIDLIHSQAEEFWKNYINNK